MPPASPAPILAKPPSGNHFAYEFRPDGTYVYTGLMQNAVFNCTSTMLGEESVTYGLNVAGVEGVLANLRSCCKESQPLTERRVDQWGDVSEKIAVRSRRQSRRSARSGGHESRPAHRRRPSPRHLFLENFTVLSAIFEHENQNHSSCNSS